MSNGATPCLSLLMQVKVRWRNTCKCPEQSLVWTNVNAIDLTVLKLAALGWVFKASWNVWQELEQCSLTHWLCSLGCLLLNVQNLSITCECCGVVGLAWLSSSSNADSQSLSVGVTGGHQEYVFGIDCVLHFSHIKGYCRCDLWAKQSRLSSDSNANLGGPRRSVLSTADALS